MRKLKKLKDRLTAKQLEARRLKREARTLGENDRFTQVWARERHIPEDFKRAAAAGVTKAKRRSLLERVFGDAEPQPTPTVSVVSKLMAAFTLRRRAS